MKIALLTAFLLVSAEGTSGIPVGILAVDGKGVLTLEKGEKVKLAGLTVTKPQPALKLLKALAERKPGNMEVEPSGAGVHVFVSTDCVEAAKALGEKLPANAGGCARSVYLNEVLLKKGYAKPNPKGVTLHNEQLFPRKPVPEKKSKKPAAKKDATKKAR